MFHKILTRLFAKDRKPESSPIPSKPLVPEEGLIPDHPQAFGYKCNWFAIRTTESDKLAAAFGIKDPIPCNWKYGIRHAYDGSIFLSPPVDGWSFIIGRQLPYAEDDLMVEIIRNMLTGLSQEFGEAHYFGTLRTAGYNAWFKAEDGRLVRAYALADGTTTIFHGEPTGAEKKYNLYNSLIEEFETAAEAGYSPGFDYPDEDMTMEIAGAWGINPQELEGRTDISLGLGLLGGEE